MRALLVVLLVTPARAQPAGELHDRVPPDETPTSIETSIDTTMRMRSDGPAVGVGVGAQLTRGDYALAVGVMRLQTIDDNGSHGSWEAAVRGYRYFQLGERTRAYVMAGASYELVEQGNTLLGRGGVQIGAGISRKIADGLTGFAQLTLEARHWQTRPDGLDEDNELQIMVLLGFTF